MKSATEIGLTSPGLRRLLSVALAGGNSVQEVSEGWSLADRIVHMTGPLSEALAQAFRSEPGLAYYTEPRTIHWPGDRGFVDDAAREAVSFPLGQQRRKK